MIRKAVLGAAIVLSGCAGTRFDWDDAARVHEGMTEPQVIAVLGKPYSRAQSGNRVVLMWSYASAFGSGRAVSYTLVNGRVVGMSEAGR